MGLNIATDHLDWHPDREEYIRAKQNIVKYQVDSDCAVLARDYEDSRNMANLTRGHVYYFSTKEEVEGGFVKEGKIILKLEETWEVGEVNNLFLRGEHNWENVAAASTAAKLAGATIEGIKKAVFSFKGLEHRLELVGTYGGISFYNDSFATSPLPTLAAVRAIDGPVIAILGGSAKGFSYRDFGRDLANQKNLKGIVVVGETGPEIKKSLEDSGFPGKIKEGVKNMEEIVKTAISLARSGDAVLLSPAAASFDMFKDYKDRGNKFREMVKSLG